MGLYVGLYDRYFFRMRELLSRHGRPLDKLDITYYFIIAHLQYGPIISQISNIYLSTILGNIGFK